MSKEPLFEKIALIGIGLIGSSISHVVRREGLVGSIAISTRSEKTLARAKELGLGNNYSTSAAEAVKNADLVIHCAPVGAGATIAKEIAPHLKPGAIVTDVGSVKSSVIAQMKPHMPQGVHFIAGHPVAGTEYSGPDAGFASLFENRWVILTPEDDCDEDALEKLKNFWLACGANLETMDAKHHDLVLAITSHIPQLISYNIVDTAANLETVTQSEIMKYSAGGFRDFTRLAASDPTMWRDVYLHNKDAVLETLGRFSEDLTAMQRAIRWSDGDALYKIFDRTRQIRRDIIDSGQEMDAPNFGRNEPSE